MTSIGPRSGIAARTLAGPALAAILAAGATAPAVPPAGAAEAPLAIAQDRQQAVLLTIYNGNLGLVKDIREVRLPDGVSEVQFVDVAAQIDPTTVHVKSLSDPGGFKILEQNYEYDLLSSQKLMEKYVGRKVRLYQNGGSFVEATLLSTSGPVYDINGAIHMGAYGQVVLPALPENLVSKPTLVWLLRNASAAPQRLETSYLTGGITWHADYVLVLNATDDRVDLNGWVTIDNKSGATYRDATLKLVAGDVNRARDEVTPRPMMKSMAMEAPQSREFSQESFFEYHLYSLDGRTTVKDSQTKQLSLLAAAGAAVKKELVYRGAQEYYRSALGAPVSNQKVSVLLELVNSQANGLGMPLPKGKVRVYKADSAGSQQLVGEDAIDHIAKDERIRVKMGDAFDVVGERVQRDWKRIASGVYEIEWEITLRNHKTEDVSVAVVEPVPGDWEVLRSTHTPEKVEAHTLRFEVPVPKDGVTKLAYRIRTRF